jgi:serine/threonine-protein kinase
MQQTVTQSVPVTPLPPAGPRNGGVGDLGLSVPIANVSCTGQHLTLVNSATTPGAYEVEIASMLAEFPGSSYLRTDASCGALTQDLNGNPIYAVYYGPFSGPSAACAARPTPESYVKVLGAGIGPDESTVEC